MDARHAQKSCAPQLVFCSICGIPYDSIHRYHRLMANPARMSFVTINALNHSPIFHTSRLAELFIETLLHHRARGHYKLHAYLVVPDRVHLLLTPKHSLDQTITLLQNTLVNRLDSTATLWEPGFTAHPIRNLRELETLRTYLHQTPVRTNLAPTPELYPYSSAFRLMKKIVPLSATTFVSELAS
jgi:putative transposase